jgi:TolB-like protein
MQSVSNTRYDAAPVAVVRSMPMPQGNTPAAPSLPAHGFTAGQVRAALLQLLASEQFSRAGRMRRLIRFLVEQELAGAVGDTGEYTIGIQVFDRDARSYTTCEDPIVRVQVGRLRARLQAYYTGGGAHAELRFSIPIGSYMPTISRHGDSAGRFPHEHLLAVTPLLAVTHDPQGIAFSQGLNEELAYQLFNAFGHKIVSHTFALAEPALHGRPAGVSHVLEGSVRVNGEQIRASLRLVDAGAGCIAWSEQFDLCGPFAIALQEQLALDICAALKRYFAHG